MLLLVSDILEAVTHAAMLPAQQMDALLAALEPRAKEVRIDNVPRNYNQCQ